jgi:hypothetical protein
MTAEYVDVVGMSTVARHQHVYGQSNGANTGVVMQTANDVRLENLWVECTRSSGGLVGDSTDPAAYFPDSDRPLTEVRNCVFTADDANAWSMRIHITYSGKYTDCTGSTGAFGGGGTASGTFKDCTGGNDAFGGGGTASGTFTNCTGGDYAFGSGGTASGTFTNCTGGGSAFAGNGGSTLNGRFVGCTMTGGLWTSTLRGRMENCRWGTGFVIGAEGRVYSSIILGNVTLTQTGAGIANSSVKGTITVGGGVIPGFNFNNLQDPDVN